MVPEYEDENLIENGYNQENDEIGDDDEKNRDYEILGYHSSVFYEKYGNSHHMCNWRNDYLKLENMVCFFF